MRTLNMTFEAIAGNAGFKPEADGKLNLPATQETADKLARAATDIVGIFEVGSEPVAATITGPGPVWGYLAIAHALHGRVVSLRYAAPNADIVVFQHGV